MSEPIVRVSALSRHFLLRGEVVRALDGVSFDVAAGSTLGIVGESGCGKSTLARLIVGLDAPTAGSIQIGGIATPPRTRADRRRRARIVQMVFQDPWASLNPRLKVGAIVGEPLLVHGVARAQRRRRVDTLLERVGLSAEAARRYPHEFSGGQRQRIGIARALALEPKVLIADEPTSALDVSVQAQILNLLADLRDDLGLTLLLVSHDLQVVEWMSDRVLVMYRGCVVEQGPASAVFEAPRHPYSQVLLDAAPRLDRIPPTDSASTGEIGIFDPDDDPASGGCAFAPRCPRVVAICRSTSPPLEPLESVPAGAGHESAVACFEPLRTRRLE